MSQVLVSCLCACIALLGCNRSEPDRPGASPASEPVPTPLDQGGSPEDLQITQQIRQRLMSDETLSFDGKNAKVITIDRKVVLRGPVASPNERDAIAKHAREVAGVDEVEVLLETPSNGETR